MRYLLVIGNIPWTQYNAAYRGKAKVKRITEHDAVQGDSWGDNEVPDRLRELLGCEPTDVIGAVMPESAWLNEANMVLMHRAYFPACEDNRWVVRPDGMVEKL